MDIGELFIGIKTIKNTELFYASTICGNREIEQLYTRRHKCQIKQGKQNFLTLVKMFSNNK